MRNFLIIFVNKFYTDDINLKIECFDEKLFKEKINQLQRIVIVQNLYSSSD